MSTTAKAANTAATPITAPQRFLALDVFRGLTICFMIIVNTSGNAETTFPALQHARWHGFTPTDLVFPSFLFAVGNAMSFVMPKWADRSAGYVVGKILKRTALIFFLGFLMYWFPFFQYDETGHLILSPISETRIFGVLQRIALAYGMASLMLYFFKTRTTVIITCLILLLYWPILYYFGSQPDPYDIHNNAVLKLDTLLIGTKHLYMGEGFPFDPEGFLSTFPAIGNVVGGFLVGNYIRRKGNTYEGLTKLLLAGFVLVVVAHFWNYVFPINKKLWTSPFVLHTVGLDCMIIASVIYIIEFRKKTSWTYFFQVFGRNPLIIYLFSELLATVFYMIQVQPGVNIYSWLFLNIFGFITSFMGFIGPYTGAFLQAVFYMLICWSIGYFMDKRKIYIRV
jgi:predicted acyltransferase